MGIVTKICDRKKYFAAQDTGKLYILGMGPNGPDLTAPRAMKILKNLDIVLCYPQTRKEFQEYIPE